MLGSSKLPVKMAGVSFAGALYAAEGAVAKVDLGVEDMESRIKSQVGHCRCRLSWKTIWFGATLSRRKASSAAGNPISGRR